MDEKTCTHCKEVKPVEAFSKRKSSRDGLQSWCKECLNARVKRWGQANPDHKAALSRRWEQENRSRVRERRRDWVKRNPDYMRKYLANWHKKNPGKIREYLDRSEARYPERVVARNALNKAIRKGEVTKPRACECCRKEASGRELHAHHEDYSKALQVEWLCRGCHNALHAALRDAEATSRTQ